MDTVQKSSIAKAKVPHPLLISSFPICIAVLLLAVMASIAFGAADINI